MFLRGAQLRGLRGFSQTRAQPRFPFLGSISYSKTPAPKFPFGLGCACKSRLGQSDGDVFSPGYDPLMSAPQPPLASAPPYSVPDTEIIGSNPNPYMLPGQMSAPVYPGASSAPASPTYSIFTNPAGGLLTAAQVQTQTPTTILAPAQAQGAITLAATTPTFSTYLPYIALAIGGVVFISALKRR
jgi:hypothetical protein